MRASRAAIALAVAVLLSAGVSLQVSARDAEEPPALARAVARLTAARASVEFADDPAALAATEELLADLDETVDARFLRGRALVHHGLVRARLEAIVARGLQRAAGRPSALRTGPPPAAGSRADRLLARRIGRLARACGDLLPAEIAAARSDVDAESTLLPPGAARAALVDVRIALEQRGLVAGSARAAERDYLRVLGAQTGFAGTVEELVALAREEERACSSALERIAFEQGAPSAAALIERLKEEGVREAPLEVARDESKRALAFTVAHGLVAIPDGVEAKFVVEETDPRARTPFGHYLPVGWGGVDRGRWRIPRADAMDAGTVARRRESHRFFFRGVAPHEGMPGHHLHFAIAARAKDPVLTLPYVPATTEGWGLYVEGMLARAGYFDEPMPARLTPVRMRLWRAWRILIDVGLATGTMTRDEGVANLQRALGFDRVIAEDEVDRYRERTGYYAAYLLGARAFEGLEKRALQRGGEKEVRIVRDRILALGPAAPLRAVVRLAEDSRVEPVR